jgi:Helicase conserved C-terminal domain
VLKWLTCTTSYIGGLDLARVVYDEAHVYLTQEEFRTKLSRIKNLGFIECQKVLLSGTIPPKNLKALLEATGLEIVNDIPSLPTKIIRAPCLQKHIRYHCLHLGHNDKLFDVLTKLVHVLNVNVMRKDSCGIIYFISKNQCTAFASNHNFPSHMSNQVTENKQAMETWTSGKSQWICATPGLAQGIDVPYVDAILFAEYPHGMVDFVQACGRGGRKGRTSYGIVVDTGSMRGGSKPNGPYSDFGCQEEMVAWCQERTLCHRFWIGKAMDGEPSYCSPSVVPCERCAPLDSTTQLIQGCRISKTSLEHSAGSSSLKRALEYLDISDPGRHVRSKPNSPIMTCPGSLVHSPESGPVLSNKPSMHSIKERGKGTDVAGAASMLQSALLKHGKAECHAKVPLLNAALEALKGICLGCWLIHKERSPANFAAACTTCDKYMVKLAGTQGYKGYVNWKSAIKHKKDYSWCFSCNVPQGDLEPACHKGSSYGTGKPHAQKDIVTRTCFIGRMYDRWWKDLCRNFNLQPSMSLQSYAEWLVVQRSVTEISNMISIFLYMYEATASSL